MPTYRGVGINFGISSSLANITGAFQTRDHNYKSETEIVKTGMGDSVAKVYYDFTEDASFTYVATGASGGAVAVTTGSIGATLTITDTVYPGIAGTTWLVDDISVASSNTGAAKVTLKLSRYPLITS